jgi:hypothetical protein
MHKDGGGRFPIVHLYIKIRLLRALTDESLQGAFENNLDSPNLQQFYLYAEY